MKTEQEIIEHILKNIKVKEYFICNKVEEVIEVTKEQLEIIREKCRYIEIRQPDVEGLLHEKDTDVVGVLRSNLDILRKDLLTRDEMVIYRVLNVEFVPNSRIKNNWKTLEDEFTFSEAVSLIKQGYKVKRKSDDETKYVYIDDEDCVTYKDGTRRCFQVSVRTSNGERIRYNKNFEDYFATDWIIVKD